MFHSENETKGDKIIGINTLNTLKCILLVVLSIQTTLVGASNFDDAKCKTSLMKRQLHKMNIDDADKIMSAIGVKPGMVIGEVGAGGGRLTVHLALGVGAYGKSMPMILIVTLWPF